MILMKQEQKIALERMKVLFEQAKKAWKKDESRARRYVKLIKRIGEKTNTSIPKRIKMFLCKECGAPLMPGVNAKTRTKNQKIIITCEECGSIKRNPYIKEKKLKKKEKK